MTCSAIRDNRYVANEVDELKMGIGCGVQMPAPRVLVYRQLHKFKCKECLFILDKHETKQHWRSFSGFGAA